MTLTKFPQGSIQELAILALPLMISSLSVMSMIFVDRVLVAEYSTESFNAVVNVTTFGWAFVIAAMVLASISEVFVAQYNGAGAKEKIGEPVWQMIWLSILSILFFVPLSIWGGEYFYGDHPSGHIAKNYFSLMMGFGPTFPLYAGLCGFFVGRGKTALITILAIVANLVNAGLDWVLIFGIPGWIPSLGASGAAIATNASGLFQSLVLFAIFISPQNREEFGTGQYELHLKSMWQCIKIGLPAATFVAFELLGWAAYYEMMGSMGDKYLTIAGICQSVLLLFYFYIEGVSKAATAVAGNLIGGQRRDLVPTVLKQGMKLLYLFLGVLLVLYYFLSDDLLRMFMPEITPEQFAEYYPPLSFAMIIMSLYLFFDGVRTLFAGILTAAGDTLFLMIAGILSIWLLLVLPVYMIIVRMSGSIETATLICLSYSVIGTILYIWRFVTGKWKELSILT